MVMLFHRAEIVLLLSSNNHNAYHVVPGECYKVDAAGTERACDQNHRTKRQLVSGSTEFSFYTR